MLAMGLPVAVSCAREPEAKSADVAIPSATSTATSTPIATSTATATATATATPTATATATAAADSTVPVTPNAAPPPPPIRDAWMVYVPNPNQQQPWCKNLSIQCAASKDVPQRTEKGPAASMGCPSLIDIPCPCGPGNPMGCQPQAQCTAPFDAKVSTQERAKSKPTACCYDMPASCVPPFVGRTLRAQGRIVVAGTEERGDWRSDARPEGSALTDAERVELANHWRNVAAAEHASIASFSRVALQMMALGAPADLVASVHAAALDEVEHARAAFALASAYSGFEEGPGALPVEALDVRPLELEALALATFLDACVGETVGTVVARESAERASDPVVRRALETIAADEERHAALAWRTIAWALRAGGDRVRAAITEGLVRLDEALAPIAPRNASLVSHGVLASDYEDAVRRRAIEEIVVPCARALIESRSAASSQRRAPLL